MMMRISHLLLIRLTRRNLLIREDTHFWRKSSMQIKHVNFILAFRRIFQYQFLHNFITNYTISNFITNRFSGYRFTSLDISILFMIFFLILFKALSGVIWVLYNLIFQNISVMSSFIKFSVI